MNFFKDAPHRMSPRSQSDSPQRRRINQQQQQTTQFVRRQVVQPQQPQQEIFSPQKMSHFFSHTEVKPSQDSVQMMPTQPRSSSLSKPVSITPMQKPQFSKHLQNQTVRQNQPALMQCVVRTSPDTTVQWFNNGSLIEPSPDYNINFDRVTGLCSLRIADAFPQDSGQYTCVATNPVGSEASTAWLVVKRKPSKY